MTADSDALRALNNDLAAVLIKHHACGIIVYGNEHGVGNCSCVTPRVVLAPRLDGGVDQGFAMPKDLWRRVQDQLLGMAEKIQRARKKL